MIEVVLLFGRLLLLALMYLFLFAAVRAGLRAVSGAAPVRKRAGVLGLAITKGPKELVGVKVPVTGRVVIGRSPETDLVIPDDFVSTRHAAVSAVDGAFVLEDLDSTNGTLLNGRAVKRAELAPGDVVEIGRVALEVREL